MIARFDNVENVGGCHVFPDAVQDIQRTKVIASSLDEENGHSEIEQHLVSKSGILAHALQGVAQTDHAIDGFLESQMAADPSAHAFPDEEHRAAMTLTRLL